MRSLLAKVLLFGVMFSIALGVQSQPAAAGRLGHDLENTILKAGPDDFIPVMIRIGGGVPGETLKRQIANVRSRAERHRAAVESMQLTARMTHGPVLNELNGPAFTGRVRDVRDFWIDNIVTAQMTPSAAAEIASRVDVEEVLYLPPVEFYKSLAQPDLVSPAEAQAGSASPGCKAIKADSAWRMGYTGKGRLVASLDTGVDGDQIFLKDKWRGNNGYSARESWFDPLDADSTPHTIPGSGDSDAHGTWTMGLMVAIQDQAVPGDASLDTVGVAFDAQWISAAVIDVLGANIIEALQWMADPDGDPNTELDVPDVVNNSWGSTNDVSGCSDVFWHAIDNVEAAGAAMVFVAGNEGNFGAMTIRNPANRVTTETNSFSVGMIDPHTGGYPIHYLSSRGPSDCDNATIKPEVVAPGVTIQSTHPGNLMVQNVLGTSFAAPHVAGAMALLREYNPNATVDEIKLALLNSAVDLGNVGPDNTYGSGLIDIPAAMKLLPANDQPSLYIKRDYYTRPAPGGSADMVIVLRSSGPAVSNVSVTLTSEDSRLTVTTGTASFGDFAAEGDTAGNFDSPFVLQVSSAALEGERLPVRFDITGSGSYTRTVYGAIQVGPAKSNELFTHDAGNFIMTVSNQATFGLSPDGLAPRHGGEGYIYGDDSEESLFEGAFLVGIDDVHVSDAARDRFTFPDVDFQVDRGGWIDFQEPGAEYAEETHAAFSDAAAENPIGLFVEQRTLASSDPANDDYLIAEYTIHNQSGAALDGLYAGMYFDWDFPWLSGARDNGGFDASEAVGWMRHRDQEKYRGLAVLTPPGMTSYQYFVNDPDIYDGFADEEKWLALSGGIVNTTPSITGDGSHLIATGPFTLASGEAVTVAFAIIGADSESDLFASTRSARNQYATGSITVVPSSLTFGGVVGGDDPADQSVTLTNNTALDADFTVTNTALMSWMSVVPTSGNVSSGGTVSLDVMAHVGELEEGSYPDSIVIEFGGDESKTFRVNTVLNVDVASRLKVDPNPFNPSAGPVTLFVPLDEAGRVEATVYDLTGEKVTDLPDFDLPAGSGTITWNGRNDDGDVVADGVYFCRVLGVNVYFARTYTIVLKK